MQTEGGIRGKVNLMTHRYLVFRQQESEGLRIGYGLW